MFPYTSKSIAQMQFINYDLDPLWPQIVRAWESLLIAKGRSWVTSLAVTTDKIFSPEYAI